MREYIILSQYRHHLADVLKLKEIVRRVPRPIVEEEVLLAEAQKRAARLDGPANAVERQPL